MGQALHENLANACKQGLVDVSGSQVDQHPGEAPRNGQADIASVLDSALELDIISDKVVDRQLNGFDHDLSHAEFFLLGLEPVVRQHGLHSLEQNEGQGLEVSCDMLDMERHALICLQACVERLHGVPQQVAPLFEGGLVHFAVVCTRRVGQLVDWADRDILDEVLVECHGCAVPSILQASVHLGQEVLLDVDVGPALREVLPDVEDGVSPKSGLEERILLADQIENQRRELAQLARNDVLRHLVDEHRHELQTGGPHTTSVAFTEEGPHVVLFLGHLCLLSDSSLPSS